MAARSRRYILKELGVTVLAASRVCDSELHEHFTETVFLAMSRRQVSHKDVNIAFLIEPAGFMRPRIMK